VIKVQNTDSRRLTFVFITRGRETLPNFRVRTLSAFRLYRSYVESSGRMTVNEDTKEVVVAYFKISHNFAGRTKETNGKLESA